MAGWAGFQNVPTDYSPNLIGAIPYELFGPGTGTRTMLNKNDEALDLWTGTVGGAVTTISFTDPNGSAQSFTITSSATSATIVAAIYAASGETLTQWATVTAPSSTVLVTAKDPRYTLTMTNTSNITWAHTTTGSVGTDIPQGRAVRRNGVGSSPGAYSTTIVDAMDGLTAQVQTITFGGTFNTGDQFDAIVFCPALNATVTVPTVTYATSEAATLTALAAAINTQVDLTVANGGLGISGSTLTCTTGTHTLIATADEPGFAFRVVVNVTNGAAGSAIFVSDVATTGSIGDPTTDASAGIAGCVPHASNIVQSGSSNVWLAGTPGAVAVAVHMTVVNAGTNTPTQSSPVYVGTASATAGKWAFEATADYVPLSPRVASVYSVDTAGGVKIMLNTVQNN